MNPIARALRSLAGFLVLFAGLIGAASAADLSHAVILVASERLAGSPYEGTVILAAPLPQGGHIGIVLNRPTGVKLESLFPDQESTHNVVEQVYAGGPMLPSVLFAVTRKQPADSGTFVPLMSGLVAVLNGPAVDRIIETSPNDARYFVGMMVWADNGLDEEISQGAWQVRAADPSNVTPSSSSGLRESLPGTEV
jgi:putative transcriptional regulator